MNLLFVKKKGEEKFDLILMRAEWVHINTPCEEEKVLERSPPTRHLFQPLSLHKLGIKWRLADKIQTQTPPFSRLLLPQRMWKTLLLTKEKITVRTTTSVHLTELKI